MSKNAERITYCSQSIDGVDLNDATETFVSTVQDLLLIENLAWVFYHKKRLVVLPRFFSKFRGVRLDMCDDAVMVGVYSVSSRAGEIIEDVRFVVSEVLRGDGND